MIKHSIGLTALSAIAIILASSQVSAKSRSGVKWVPLDEVQHRALKKTPASEPTAESTRSEAPSQPASPAAAPASQAELTAAPARSDALQLTCFGSGTANKLAVATVNSNSYVSGSVGTTPFSGSGSGNSTLMGTRQQDFGDQVDIRLFTGDDRIRMPRTMLPPIHGGDAGWFKLKNVVADARSIRAKAAVNFMNSPNVFIDRVTGTISISGKAGDYTGHCQVIDSNSAPKF